MAANSIDYAKLFSTVMDEVALPGLTSAKMNSKKYKVMGGNEIKLPKMSVTGLSDYSRETGYRAGAITFEYETKTITKDRGVSFTLDVMDEDESGFVATAGAVTNELNKVEVVPEIDAYRYSKIFSIANTNIKTGSYVPDEATIFETLAEDISDIEDIIGQETAKTIYMSYDAARILSLADKIEKRLDVNTNSGALKSKVMSLDGIEIIRVPSARFKTSYTFGNDGFTVDAIAMGINWIIADDNALVGVTKHDKLKVFTPDQNQSTDGYLIQYRRYHDLFMPDNKIAGVYLSYTAIDAPELAGTFAKGTGTGNTKFTLNTALATGETMFYKLGAAASTVKYNDVPSGFTTYVSGADIVAIATQYLAVIKVVDGHVTELADSILTGLISTGD